jgi:hypothetical protein
VQVTPNQLKRIKTQTRPICVRCQREMILTTIVMGGNAFCTFLCDCLPQPEGVAFDIVQAREWDHQTLYYSIDFDHYLEEEEDII